MTTLTHRYTDPVHLDNGVLLWPGQPVTLEDDVAAACVALAPGMLLAQAAPTAHTKKGDAAHGSD